MPFILIKKPKRKVHSVAPFISVNPKGFIGISVRAYRLFHLHKFKTVELYYCDEKNQIGLLPKLDSCSKDKYKLVVHPNEGTCRIASASFFKSIELDPPKKVTRFEPSLKQNGMIVFSYYQTNNQ